MRHTADLQFMQQHAVQAVCVLAGCDFLPSVKGVGVHKAHKLVKRYRMLSRAVTLLKDDRKLAVPREYGADAARAVRCFQHALVLDPSGAHQLSRSVIVLHAKHGGGSRRACNHELTSQLPACFATILCG